MKYIVKGCCVYKAYEIQTQSQTAAIEEFHSYVLKIILSYSEGIVKAKILNYLDEPQEDYNEPIKFECEGQILEIDALNGMAEITIEVPEDESVTVRTVNANMANGEVIINA